MKSKDLNSKNKIRRIEVVFPCHNRRELTLLCLRSLSRINSANLDVHVVLVDDGSTDGTSEAVAKEFPSVEIIKADGSLWFTEGTNVAARAALKHDPDYILMMNDDQVFDADFLRYLVETAEKNPRSVVGPLLLLWDTPHKLFQIAPQWKTFSGGWRHFHKQTIWTVPAKPFKVELIVGNCVLIPVKAIEECGLMNSTRYPNFGDAEYTPRLKKNGWELLIEPRSRVFCQPNTLPPTVTKMSFRQMFDALIFNLGHTHNLRRHLYADLDTAPTKLHGLTAFAVFCMQVALRKNRKEEWNSPPHESAFSEIYADAVVE